MSDPSRPGGSAPGTPPPPPPPPAAPLPEGAGPSAYAPPDGVIPREQATEETPADAMKDATWDDVKNVREQEANAGYAPGEAPQITYDEHDGPQVIRTGSDKGDGLDKCPKCGSTDIGFDIASGMLFCRFCRHRWAQENAVAAFGLDTPISELRGRHIGSGSGSIVPGVDEVVTFKCQACGAEIAVDTAHAMQARCHWCRNTLSVNQQIDNGAVPDVVLPFSLPKDEAVARIAEFVKKRRFFANRRFTAQFAPENVMGVYLPYLVVDFNANVQFAGTGEHTTRKYTVGQGDDRETRYDYDVYQVGRTFSLYVDDLTIESAADKRDFEASRNTNNIINAIMPFDTKNAVRYDANYLSGFTSQRRDLDLTTLFAPAQEQAEDIGRFRAAETVGFYDRGVRWEQQDIHVVGDRWISAYLPVWLYSYLETKGNGRQLLHYIAVNGRTGETMGSVPINTTRLWIFSGIAEVFGIIGTVLTGFIFWR
ncbi:MULTISPECIES: TFIIB-type zinc ribbon-containing protein [unclassified Microbacterium]|uniref:TFIIB-type zinc ribbon-containing protein n=1 Tax=unclassified Microbacterium TaxID=2609290 RepID=UPI0030191CBA